MMDKIEKAPLLPLPPACCSGIFLRRVKRFSVEVECGERRIWTHCNNSGAMLGLLEKGAPVIISAARGKRRKLPFTLERIWLAHRGIPEAEALASGRNGFWVGVNTSLPNKMLAASFQAGLLDFAKGYNSLRGEVRFGQSRLDARLDGPGLPPLWIECKNVTLMEDDAVCFPDAASERAKKHLRELMDIVGLGQRAAMFYLVQRPDGHCFAPADFIDEAYAELFYQALDAGVECYAFRADLLPGGANLGQPVRLRACTGTVDWE